MRYECHNCGRRFEKPDIITETHGLDIGPYEKIGVCPYCKGFFEEVFECKICGEWFTDSELTSGVCDDCVYEHDTDVELCYKFGDAEEARENISINGFIASIFTAEELEELAINELRKAKRLGATINCIEFIGSDKSWFAEQLIKEKQNAEKF